MPSRTYAKAAPVSRDKFLWAVLVTLLVAQLVAFWALCNHQVRKAELRHADVQVERTAMADCLQHTPRSSIQNCATRVSAKASGADDTTYAAKGAQPAGMGYGSAAYSAGQSGLMPAYFAFR